MNTVFEWNQAYAPIMDKANELVEQLTNKGYDCTMEFKNNLSVKDEEGNAVTEYFPVPVIRVNDGLDVTIHPFGVMLTIAMTNEIAVRFRFQSLFPRHFEIHGMANPTLTFYNADSSFDELWNRIANSEEEQVGITFTLPIEGLTSDILDLIEFGFHA